MYSDDFVNTGYTVHMEACAVTQEDAHNDAFDEIVTEHEAGEAAAAIPLNMRFLRRTSRRNRRRTSPVRWMNISTRRLSQARSWRRTRCRRKRRKAPKACPEHTETPAVPNAATAP